MKNILLDADGVLFSWTTGFSMFLKNSHNIDINPADQDNWLLDRWIGCSPEEAEEYIKEFNSYSWEFGCLPEHPGAIEAIKILKNEGFSMSVITACNTDTQTVALRRANLYHLFGNVFDAIHCVQHNESKRTHLADYRPSFWVEDKVSNAQDGLDYGHKSIVLRHRHNSDLQENSDKRLAWMNDWSETLEFILNAKH